MSSDLFDKIKTVGVVKCTYEVESDCVTASGENLQIFFLCPCHFKIRDVVDLQFSSLT